VDGEISIEELEAEFAAVYGSGGPAEGDEPGGD